MHTKDWDDLRIVLMVAETGSVAAAAKRMGVAHTTVLRRLSAFEAATGARLFERTGRGYSVNEDRSAAFEAMADAARAVERAWAAIDAAALPPGDMLRLTSTDTLTTTVLPKVAESLRAKHPDLEIAILSFNTHLNLAHGHADLTLRPALSLPEDLEGEVVAQLALAEYGSEGAPEAWVRASGPLLRSHAGRWLAERPAVPGLQADSFVVMRELVAAGHGRSLLPCILADEDPRLIRHGPPIAELDTPLWLAGHRELADTGRINRIRRDIVAAIGPYRRALNGGREWTG